MSIDRSLHIKSGAASSRNVLKRSERVAIMMDNDNFDLETGSPLGIPKTRVKGGSSGGGKAKAKEEAPATEEAADQGAETAAE